MITATLIIGCSVKPFYTLREYDGIKNYTVNALREYLEHNQGCPLAFGLFDRFLSINRNHAAYALACIQSDQLPTLIRYIDENGEALG